MEVLNDIKNVRLSPVALVAILAASTALSLSKPARGETPDQASSSAEAAIQDGDAMPLEIKLSDKRLPRFEENQNPSPMGDEVMVEMVSEPELFPSESSIPQNQKSYQIRVNYPLFEGSREQGTVRPASTLSAGRNREQGAGKEKDNKLIKGVLDPDSVSVEENQNPSPMEEEVVVEMFTQAELLASESSIAQNQTPDSSDQVPSQEPRVLVAEVVVSGAEGELKDLVYNTISSRPGRTTTRSQLQEDVNAIYATGFYANVKVIPEDTPLGVRVTFSVEPNPVLSEVVIETVPPDIAESVLPPEVLNDIFSDQYGQILNLRDLQEQIKELNEWYSENGYELAQVIGAPRVAEDGTVTLVVAEGVIEDIQVRFFDEEDEPLDGHTRDFIITREVELKSGDVFNREIAQRDLQRVFGLGILEDVRFSFSPGDDPSKVDINVDVVEGSTGSFAAGAGISSTSGLFGTVSYQQQNLGGNNQTLGAEFQLGTRELLFDVSFTDPWIAGDSYRTSYTVNGFRRRSISLVFDGDGVDIDTANGNDSPRVVRTGGGVTFFRPIPANPFGRPDWRLSAGWQYQRVRIENADGDIAPRSRVEQGFQRLAFSDSGEDDLFIFRFGASRDKRNDPLRPTSGSLLRFGLDQTAPIGSGNISFSRLRGNFSYYIPVKLIRFDFSKGPQAFAFNIQSGTVMGDLPPYEAFVLGGSNSVRGFSEGKVGSGRSFFQATAEYRFPIISFVGGAVFFDYGSTLGSDIAVIGRPSRVRGLPGEGYGYGVGVRVQSPLGPIRVDYAVNDDGDNRIHFGIGERF
ncbi:MAG: BamA/TamA family outer membrane protein [Xenococcaceae cyanobacterium]